MLSTLRIFLPSTLRAFVASLLLLCGIHCAKAQSLAEASHYWDGFPYGDEQLCNDSAALMEAFAQWVAMLQRFPVEETAPLVGRFVSGGEPYPRMQLRLLEVGEEVLADPNSPLRCEELFIPMLQAFIAAPLVADESKLRPRYLLAEAMKNRVGTEATDLHLLTREGRETTLGEEAYGLPTLLYFFNPECHDCKRVTAYMAQSPLLSRLVGGGRLAVVAVYPDEELDAWQRHLGEMPTAWTVARLASQGERDAYALPAIPCLYLIGADGCVILKDAPVERVEAALGQ